MPGSFYPKQILTAADLNAATAAAPENITVPMAAADVKLTPVAADMVPIMDSQAGGALKRMSFDALKVSPTDAGLVIYGPTGQSVAVVLTAHGNQIATISTGQTSGVIGYDTLANLNADLAHAAQTVAYVMNDATAANNGVYRKLGASGAGSWVQSSGGYTLQAYIDAILPKNTTSKTANAFSGIFDQNGRLAIRVDRKGHVWIAGSDVTELAKGSTSIKSKTAFKGGFVDSVGRMGLAFDRRGNPVFRGVRLDVSGLNTLASNFNTLAYPSANIAVWGDSLSSNSANAYPTLLAAAYPARQIYKGGIGGQKSYEIFARQGSNGLLVSLTGNQIPAGTTPVSLTYWNPQPMNGQNSWVTLSGWIEGVYGTLTYSAGPAFTFTRAVAGTAQTVDKITNFIPDVGSMHQWTQVFWVGRNNVSDVDFIARVKSDIAQAVASLATVTKRFLVLSIITNTAEHKNAAGANLTNYNNIMQINNDLRQLYPTNFVDIRELLWRNYNPGIPQDVTDYTNDTIPTSLTTDGLHPTDAAHVLISNKLQAVLAAKGW